MVDEQNHDTTQIHKVRKVLRMLVMMYQQAPEDPPLLQPSGRLCENALYSPSLTEMVSPSEAGDRPGATLKARHATRRCDCQLSSMTT
jgi:hypothetical protein